MLKLIPILFILTTSCATAKKWKLVTIEHRLMNWRLCSKVDGELNNTGFCFITKECQRSKLIFKECRNVTNYCKFGDRDCYNTWSLTYKKLSSE